MTVAPQAETSVFTILRRLRSSIANSPRDFRTVSRVSTTLWKLLAAPLSCVKRAMLRRDRFPCSITVMISPAKATSFISRSRMVSSARYVHVLVHLQFLAATLPNTTLLSLSTCTFRIPYRFHSRRILTISWRALRLETEKQMNFMAGLTLKSFAIQLLWGSICRDVRSSFLALRRM
jgi:hypothetical protein